MTFDKHSHPGRLKAWLSLLRPPNMLTVPGDPLAGAMLSAGSCGLIPSGSSVLAVIAAALFLYAGGLLANDFFDRKVDARERPSRPIPSGAVRAQSVLLWALLLTGVGLLVATQAGRTTALMAFLIAALSWFYNAIGKNVSWLAPINMGLCRGGSLMMGASITGGASLTSPPVLGAMVLITSYVALITIAARHEAAPEGGCQSPAWVSWGLPAVVLAGLSVLMVIQRKGGTPSLAFDVSGFTLALAGMALIWVVLWSIQVYRASSPREIQLSIAGLIRGLLLIQAALCASSGLAGEGLSLLLLIAFPVSGWMGKWFYGS